MSWCPKCKMEYVDGILECSDCGTKLIDQEEDGLEFVTVLHVDKEETATKFIQFLEYSNIDSTTYSYDDKANNWQVLAPEGLVLEIQKLFKAFYSVESEASKEDEEKQAIKNPVPISSTYVKKEEKYEDLKSSALTFLIFGVIGIIFVLLNVFGVLSFLNGLIPQLVMGVLFVVFLFIGISSHKNATLTKSQIGTENDLTTNINNWLKQNLSSTDLDEMNDDTLSEEINFFNKLEKMKEMTLEQFGTLNESYLDQLVEEFYNNNFEK